MFGLPKHGPDGRYGVVVDIGSGSIGVAIVASDPLQENPEIIWYHRERMVIREGDTLKESSKNITSALLNVFLEIGNTGIRTLLKHEKQAKVDLVQITVSAPWSYTIAKTVTYKQEQSFEISKEMIADLVATAQKQAIEAIDENSIIEKLGLKTIVRATINISANDYVVEKPYGQKANSITISHVSAIAQKKLLDTAIDNAEKVLPSTPTQVYSFMLLFYCVLQELAPDTSEVCLVDITSEATEVAIVRDGIIKYVTHTPTGMFTLARNITKVTGVPTEEALAYIRGNIALETTLSDSMKQKFDETIAAYEKEISELLKRTGDTLTIPRSLFLHTDARAELFFKARIKNASIVTTNTEHNVHLITEKIMQDTQLPDTSMLISAHFFHKKEGYQTFEHI